MPVIEFQRVSKRYQIGQGSYGTLREDLSSLARVVGRRLAGKRTSEAGNRELWAVKDVSFTVDRSESLGIIGPNGAGKSTILKLLGKVTAATHGTVTIGGRVAALIELGAGFHPELTGRENIYLNGSIMGMKKREIDQKLDSIVAFSELELFIDTPVKRYSSGMYARLGFSVAAHVDPDILLIDEVLSVGDIGFQVKCLRRMEEYRRSGAAIVFVSHNLDAVRNLCSQAILLDHGQVVANGSVEDAIIKYHQVISSRETAWQSGDGIHRSQDKKARIIKMELLDQSGRPRLDFKAGDEARLVVTIALDEDFDSPFVGFIVRRSDRLIAMDTNSTFLGAGLATFARGSKVIVEFEFVMNLLKGDYHITSHVKDKDRRQFYDYADSAITFSVTDSYSFAGIADLRPRCRMRAIDERPTPAAS